TRVVDAQRGAALTSFAEIEVARGQGAPARRFATAMATLSTELQGGHRQAALLNNIEHATGITDAQRTSMRGMFDHGHLREQFTTGLGFAARMNEITGGNT